MPVEFTSEGCTLEIFDPIMRHRAALEFPEPIDPEPIEADDFVFPVDRAVTFRASGVRNDIPMVYSFDGDGSRLEEVDPHHGTSELPAGEYYFSLREGVKVYLRVDASTPVTVSAHRDETRASLEFEEEAPVVVGVRSLHERPEATITTTGDPEDLMAAVSMLGSALKDTGPMHSFPTLRGYPPAISLGDELQIPDVLDAPDTGIRLELPPERQYVYAATPLAYYLGAEVVPSQTPMLTTETGVEYPLDEGWNIEQELNRLLRRTFFLDALVRQDDPYCIKYPSREEFEDVANVSLDGLYELSPAERLGRYLDFPEAAIDHFDPNWPTGARVASTPDTAELLPFLANELAAIHPLRATKVGASTDDLGALDDGPRPPVMDFDELDGGTVLDPESLDTARELWIGPGTPLGVEEPMVDAIRRGHERAPVDGDIEYVVVCNDDRMVDEDELVRNLLNERAGLSFTIDAHRNLTTDELRDVLARDTEVLHFIGHAEPEGLVCTDGYLDAASLESVGTDVFFFNSCFSYEQGRHLLDSGAMAGIVALGEVSNALATRVGRQVATLLNHGITVGGALEVVRDAIGGGNYTTLGHTSFQVVRSDIPGVDTIVDISADEVSHSYHLASLRSPGPWIQRLASCEPADRDIGTPLSDVGGIGFRCVHDREGYITQIEESNAPVWIDGDLRHVSQIDTDELL